MASPTPRRLPTATMVAKARHRQPKVRATCRTARVLLHAAAERPRPKASRTIRGQSSATILVIPTHPLIRRVQRFQEARACNNATHERADRQCMHWASTRMPRNTIGAPVPSPPSEGVHRPERALRPRPDGATVSLTALAATGRQAGSQAFRRPVFGGSGSVLCSARPVWAWPRSRIGALC